MGLSLNNIYQRPYLNNNTNTVKRRDDNEKSSESARAQAQRQENLDQNARSKGLQYIDQKTPAYAPAYEQRFNIPTSAYEKVNVNAVYGQNASNVSAISNNEYAGVSNEINIAQILNDLKNTAITIDTPKDINEDVEKYISLVEKQAKSANPNEKLIKSNLYNAATLLDEYISQTLNKDSRVVYNWIDALFLQKIDFKYNEDDINERFLVKFPDGTTSQTIDSQEVGEIPQETEEIQSEPQRIVDILPENNYKQLGIPEDENLKGLFIKAKKLSYANKIEKSIKTFEQALNRAVEIGDEETAGKIYFEVGKIYDDNDYLAQALKSYNQSTKLSSDDNVKTRAHYSMAQIYDDVNQISPALDHYVTAVSYAGNAENLPAQSASLTKIGNIYTDMYDKESFEYYSLAADIAQETDSHRLKGFVSLNTAKAYRKFDEPEKALKSFSSAAKDYIEAKNPTNIAKSYLSAADVMVEFNKIAKAQRLLDKSLKFASQTNNLNLINEIQLKQKQLQLIS